MARAMVYSGAWYVWQLTSCITRVINMVRFLECHERIGGFPRKGVMLHYQFAKLHLYSHVFRGLQNATIPVCFQEFAAAATTAAVAIISTLINDPEIQPALIGIPSYMHSMTAFAAMFLAKATMTYGHQLVERSLVVDLVSRLINLYHSTTAGKFHLVNMMANGLEKIVMTLQNHSSQLQTRKYQNSGSVIVDDHAFPHFGAQDFDGETSIYDANFLMDFNMNIGTSAMQLGSGPTVFETTDLSPTFL